MKNKKLSSETHYHVIKNKKGDVISVARSMTSITTNSEMQMVIYPPADSKIEDSTEVEYIEQEKKLKSKKPSADPE